MPCIMYASALNRKRQARSTESTSLLWKLTVLIPILRRGLQLWLWLVSLVLEPAGIPVVPVAAKDPPPEVASKGVVAHVLFGTG